MYDMFFSEAVAKSIKRARVKRPLEHQKDVCLARENEFFYHEMSDECCSFITAKAKANPLKYIVAKIV